MNPAKGLSRDVVAILTTAIGSSLLAFVILIATGWIGAPSGPGWAQETAALLAIVFIWGPAFAAIPAAVLGFLLERHAARRLIARRRGGFAGHLVMVVGSALLLWLLIRLAVVLSGPQDRIMDSLSLVLFVIIGLCSALSWWFLVVIPGRRA